MDCVPWLKSPYSDYSMSTFSTNLKSESHPLSLKPHLSPSLPLVHKPVRKFTGPQDPTWNLAADGKLQCVLTSPTVCPLKSMALCHLPPFFFFWISSYKTLCAYQHESFLILFHLDGVLFWPIFSVVNNNNIHSLKKHLPWRKQQKGQE